VLFKAGYNKQVFSPKPCKQFCADLVVSKKNAKIAHLNSEK